MSTTIENLVGSLWEYDEVVVRITGFGAHPANLEPLVFCSSLTGEGVTYAYNDFFDNFHRVR